MPSESSREQRTAEKDRDKLHFSYALRGSENSAFSVLRPLSCSARWDSVGTASREGDLQGTPETHLNTTHVHHVDVHI